MVYKKDLELQKKWVNLLNELQKMIGVKPKDVNSVLFLVGMQELGSGIRDFSKEEKQDLMHIATCKILSLSGYYRLEGLDEDGWPHWIPTGELPKLSLMDQEKLLKLHLIEYFEKELQIILSP